MTFYTLGVGLRPVQTALITRATSWRTSICSVRLAARTVGSVWHLLKQGTDGHTGAADGIRIRAPTLARSCTTTILQPHKWSQRLELNQLIPLYEGGALPVSFAAIKLVADHGSQTRYLMVMGHEWFMYSFPLARNRNLVRHEGFEPPPLSRPVSKTGVSSVPPVAQNLVAIPRFELGFTA